MKKFLIVLIFLLSITSVFAIPSPDFFIAFFQTFLQFLGIIFAIFVSYVIVVFRYIKNHKKKLFHILAAFLIILILSFGVFNYLKYKSEKNEIEWRNNVKEDISNSISESIKINSENYIFNSSDEEKNTYYKNLINFSYNRDYYNNIYLNDNITINNISLNEFDTIYSKYNINKDFYVFDLRERIEYEVGHINGSIHSRDVDFILNDAVNILPENKSKLIILVCYSSLSSSYFSYYLNSIGYENVKYISNGLTQKNILNYDWFLGNYNSNYDDIEYINFYYENINLSLENIQFLDGRLENDFNLCHLNNSISVFRDSIPTPKIIEFLEKLDKNKKYYLVCNGAKNCWSTYNLGRDLKHYENITPIGLIDLSIEPSSEFFYKNCHLNSNNYSDLFWKEHKIISNLNSERIIFNNSNIKNNIITEDEFIKLRDRGNMLIIDVRDNISYSRGSLEGAVHSKLADLINYDWKNLNLSKYDSIFLLCYGGTSGYLATEFLYNNGYTNVYYFENGVYDIYDDEKIGYFGEKGLILDDKIKYDYMSKSAFNYFTNSSDVQVLEIRPYDEYIKNKKTKDSLYFFHEAMTSKQISNFYNNLDKNKDYILYCDSSLTCWLTYVIYLEMTKNGFNYIGKYTDNLNYLNEIYRYGLIDDYIYNDIVYSS